MSSPNFLTSHDCRTRAAILLAGVSFAGCTTTNSTEKYPKKGIVVEVSEISENRQKIKIASCVKNASGNAWASGEYLQKTAQDIDQSWVDRHTNAPGVDRAENTFEDEVLLNHPVTAEGSTSIVHRKGSTPVTLQCSSEGIVPKRVEKGEFKGVEIGELIRLPKNR